MSFSPVKNVRIRSLTPNAVVRLRLGKAAVKSKDDTEITAKVLRHYEEGEKSFVVFEDYDGDGNPGELTITRFPGAPWRTGQQYVSLVAVDESTFTIQKAASPIQTDVLGEAIKMIEVEKDDVYGWEQLIALFTHVQDGKRINTETKALTTRLAFAIVDELKKLPPRD